MRQSTQKARASQSRAAVSAVSVLLALAVLGGEFGVVSEAALQETTRREAPRDLRPVRTLVRAIRDLVDDFSRHELACRRVAEGPASKLAASSPRPLASLRPSGVVDLRPERIDLPPPAA